MVLVDIVEGVPQGKALDLAESAPSKATTAESPGLIITGHCELRYRRDHRRHSAQARHEPR